MSHFSLNRVNIKNPDLSILREVGEKIAKELGGELVDTIRDYYGRTQSGFVFAVKSPDLPWGVGVRVASDGSVEVVADRWAHGRAVAAFEQRLTQLYTARAVATALTQMGYQVSADTATDQIVIKAVSYL